MKRRLIVCCDGTWQDLEQVCCTNVVKIAQAIKPVDNVNNNPIAQIIYYDEGLGTKQINSKLSIIDTLIKLGGGALGLGIDHKIQDAYRFLCLNYEPDDEIYLFGFSRGAYTVRCLAGLIYNSGLLHRQFICEIPQAYELYREKRNPDKAPNGKEAVQFRKKYGREVSIKALCCWDTVGALGLPDLIHSIKLDEQFNERYRFFDTTVNAQIDNAIHAVAIDEIRKVFDVTLMQPSRENQVTQMWFSGGHGCIGGGSIEERGLSDIALDWMLEQVEAIGLAVDRNLIEGGINPHYDSLFNNKPEWPFNIPGVQWREITDDFSHLHESVIERWNDPKCDYRPPNLEKFTKLFQNAKNNRQEVVSSK